ncbi:MAG: hypothetical protein CMN30_19680 [Sandaracinus sp.]|nr:hypothetical protein [Sandaracinus sp.]
MLAKLLLRVGEQDHTAFERVRRAEPSPAIEILEVPSKIGAGAGGLTATAASRGRNLPESRQQSPGHLVGALDEGCHQLVHCGAPRIARLGRGLAVRFDRWLQPIGVEARHGHRPAGFHLRLVGRGHCTTGVRQASVDDQEMRPFRVAHRQGPMLTADIRRHHERSIPRRELVAIQEEEEPAPGATDPGIGLSRRANHPLGELAHHHRGRAGGDHQLRDDEVIRDLTTAGSDPSQGIEPLADGSRQRQ